MSWSHIAITAFLGGAGIFALAVIAHFVIIIIARVLRHTGKS